MSTKETAAPAAANTKAIPERILNLAGRFKDAFKVTSTGLVEVEPDLYAKTLPEGLTMDTVLAVKHHDRDVVVATRLANAEVGLPYLAKHPKVEQVTVEFQGGPDTFGEVLSREKPVPDGKGGMQTKIGHTRSYYEAGADQDKSTLNRVNAHIAVLTAQLLGKGK